MTWSKIKFNNLYSEPSRNGVYKSTEFHGSGVKVVNMGELFAYDRIGPQAMNRIELSAKEMDTFLLKENDLLFARRSLVESGAGKAAIVQHLTENTTFESSVIRVRLDGNRCNPLFYLYWFRSPNGRAAIQPLITGINVKGIRGSELSQIEVDYPSVEVQNRIVSILSAYDDLIENNQKQIKLLEEAAQRLYKEWFIDLRFPGHESTPIVAGIPEGWQKKKISEVCDTVGGGTPSTAKSEYFENGTIKWVTPTDLTKKNSLILLDTEKKITQAGLDNSSAKLLPPETILMTSRASIGYFAVCEYEVCTNQGFIACIPKEEDMRFYLLFNLMSRTDEIKGKATGSTFLEITKRAFRNMSIIVPEKHIMSVFDKYVSYNVSRMRVLEKENARLIMVRDRLLSKLMSGELEV